MVDSYTFLLVSTKIETQWVSVLRQALSPLGSLHIMSEEEVLPADILTCYDLIIVDAGAVCDTVSMVSRLREEQPRARIVIATASPTWKRARDALQAGAVDYVRKSLDEEETRSRVQAILGLPLSP